MKENNNAQIHIIVDDSGLVCVRIVGPSEEHKKAHDLYFALNDYLEQLDQKIKQLGQVNDDKTQH